MPDYMVTYKAIIDDGPNEFHYETIGRYSLSGRTKKVVRKKATEMMKKVIDEHRELDCDPAIDDDTDIDIFIDTFDAFRKRLQKATKELQRRRS